MRALAVWVVLLGLSAPSPSPGGPARPVSSVRPPGSPVAVATLPGDTRPFSTYDFRQRDFGDVDWPVGFVFRGRVDVAAIKQGLCKRSTHLWKYCDSGGPMYLFHGSTASAVTGEMFVSDKGAKRFNETCSTTRFSAHIRLYTLTPSDDQPAPSAARPADAAQVVGTVHLDFDDKGGCSGRIHGYPDVAEQWLVEAMKTVPGWTVTPDAWDLRTGSKPYVVLRRVGGVEVPHVYGQDGLATDVYVP